MNNSTDFLNLSLDSINKNLSIYFDIPLTEENISNIDNGIFSTFWSYINYALDILTPLAGCVCEYFREDVSHYDIS